MKIQLNTQDQFLLQNFIIFLAFKEKKFKKKRMNKYSMLAMGGVDYDEDLGKIQLIKFHIDFNRKSKQRRQENEY